MLAVIVAEEFGIPPASVGIRIGDTRFPIGPDSGGSVTAGSITPAARNAAYQAKQKLFAAVAPQLGTTSDNLATAKRTCRLQKRCFSFVSAQASNREAAYGPDFCPGNSCRRIREGADYLRRSRLCGACCRYRDGARAYREGLWRPRLRASHQSPGCHQPDQRRHPSGNLVCPFRATYYGPERRLYAECKS